MPDPACMYYYVRRVQIEDWPAFNIERLGHKKAAACINSSLIHL